MCFWIILTSYHIIHHHINIPPSLWLNYPFPRIRFWFEDVADGQLLIKHFIHEVLSNHIYKYKACADLHVGFNIMFFSFSFLIIIISIIQQRNRAKEHSKRNKNYSLGHEKRKPCSTGTTPTFSNFRVVFFFFFFFLVC